MRKLLLLAAITAGVIGMSTASFAALGFHDTSASTTILGGACAQCHNNTATAVFRGWGNTTSGVPATGWYTRNVTALCWSCHNSGGLGGAHDVTATVMNGGLAGTHGYTVANAPYGPDGVARETFSATGLPYVVTAGVDLQCTTCHNVHNDQYYPYMMKTDMDSLCTTCHLGRTNAGNLGSANSQAIGGGTAYSTHPTDVAVASTGGARLIATVAQMDASMKINHSYTAGTVSAQPLGGHLETAPGNAGNMVCVTCHAVHGANDGAGTITTGVEDYLAIDNNAADGTASSDLCLGCHGGPNGIVAVGTTVRTGTDHPIDSNGGRASFYRRPLRSRRPSPSPVPPRPRPSRPSALLTAPPVTTPTVVSAGPPCCAVSAPTPPPTSPT